MIKVGSGPANSCNLIRTLCGAPVTPGRTTYPVAMCFVRFDILQDFARK